jgi:hypothetical protein
MGGQKELLIEEADRDVDVSAGEGFHVCAGCFRDSYLRDLVVRNVVAIACDFCEATSDQAIAAPLTCVLDCFDSCIGHRYVDASGCTSYDREDDVELGPPTFDGDELLQDMDIDGCLAEDRDSLRDAIAGALEDKVWCTAHGWGMTEAERLSTSWDGFCDAVKHRNRFFFREEGIESDGEPLVEPGEMLKRNVSTIVAFGLMKTYPAGTRLYRAHLVDAKRRFESPSDYGAPPPMLAGQNRMSPAGISMTYLAEDAHTALAEIADEDDGKAYLVAEFELLNALQVIDLTELPEHPSIFDAERSSQGDKLKFLYEFQKDVSKPIDREGMHIDYVPTQIVTEYFRTSKEMVDRKAVGLCYASSRCSGRCLVLFEGPELVEVDGPTQRLRSWLSGRRVEPCLRFVGRTDTPSSPMEFSD